MASVNPLLTQALDHHQHNRLDQAKQTYLQLLKEEPNNSEILDLMGVLLNQQNLPEDSLSFFDDALVQDPTNPVYHNHKGNALCALKQFDLALHHFEQALTLNPQYAEAWNNCGNTYLRMKHYPQAIEHYQQAIELKADYADAQCNLGLAYCQQGELTKADEVILKVLIKQPDHSKANYYQRIINDEIAIAQWINQALSSLQQGDKTQAIHYYQQVLRLQPKNSLASFHLAALQGKQQANVDPTGFVTNLFNHYAPHYENHLINQLQYQVPTQLFQYLSPYLPPTQLTILDLGCGTGLMGDMLKDQAALLIGVDLSQNMLDQAAKKACYHQLVCLPSLTYLDQTTSRFNLVIAADVFVYQGDLSTTFQAIKQQLAPQGLFAFSVEIITEGDYRLLPTARFAHNLDYIRQLAAKNHFAWLNHHYCTLRQQGKKPVAGAIILLSNG